MGLTSGDRHDDPRTVAVRRGRFSVFSNDSATANNADDEETPQAFDSNPLAASLARTIARREWALTHGERGPLPVVGADGHVMLPPELLAQRAAEAAEAEAERLAGLTPGRLAAVQTRRWVDWLAEYELHKPTYLRLSVGPRGEMLARQQLAAFEWSDEDERHPDGGRVVVRGVSSAQPLPIEERPRAFPNERVLDAIAKQLLGASWLRSESNKPAPPTPLTFEERLQAMADEREARAAARRAPDYNYQLLIVGGRPGIDRPCGGQVDGQ